jgi:hypothetical protein
MDEEPSIELEEEKHPVASTEAIAQAMFLCGQFTTQIFMADTKAAVTLGGAAVLATVATLDTQLLGRLFDPSGTLLEHLRAVLVLIMFGLLLWSVANALISTLPATPRPKRSNLFYFVSIRDMTEEAYRQAFLKQTPQEVEAAIFNQVHVLAGITYHKFALVRRGLYLLVIAFSIWLLIHLLLVF